MTNVQVCFKCHKAYTSWTSEKRKGAVKPEEYSKYICKDCYNAQFKEMRDLQNRLEGL